MLAIELPSFGVEEAEETLIVSSVCMSLRSIRCIHEIMQKNIEEVKQMNESFSKYVFRVQFLLESQDGTGLSVDIFNPTEKNFHGEPADGLPPPTKEEFADAYHYVMLQDIHLKEVKDEEIPLDKWQHCIVSLLIDIDLSSYYEKSTKEDPAKGRKGSRLSKLLHQVYKSPSTFVSDPEKSGRVKLMAYYLINYLEKEGEEDVKRVLESLRNAYQSVVEAFVEKQQRAEQSLRITINALATRCASIKSQISRYIRDVFTCVLARRFINSYVCPYEIKRISGPQLRSAEKLRRCTAVITNPAYDLDSHVTADRECNRFVIILPDPIKSKSSSKTPMKKLRVADIQSKLDE